MARSVPKTLLFITVAVIFLFVACWWLWQSLTQEEEVVIIEVDSGAGAGSAGAGAATVVVIEGMTDNNGNPVVDPNICSQVNDVYNEYKAAKEAASKQIMKIVYGQDNLSLYTDCINNLDNCPDICKPKASAASGSETIDDPTNG